MDTLWFLPWLSANYRPIELNHIVVPTCFPPKTEGREDMVDFCIGTLFLCPLTEFQSVLDSSEMPFDKAGLSYDNNDTVEF